ncbi:MAG: ABC transporter permease [Arachidicoccus sp.]|nr:ABC transporter permease [Arachidicoccus sp.]
MFKHYIKTAWRNLVKNKPIAFINVFGLMVGIVSCLLIGLYIQHELSYDKFQKKGDRIVRVVAEYKFSNGDPIKGFFTGPKVFPVFKKQFPEVEQGVRMTENNAVVTLYNKQFDEPNFMYADSTFFELFSFKLIQGNPKQALSGLNKIVLTQATAQKYFGNENPIGKVLQIGSDKMPYEVTGVIQDCPSGSQIQFDFLASFSSLGVSQRDTYFNANYATYLLLRNKNDMVALQRRIPVFMKKEMQGQNVTINYSLEPFKWIHLHSPYDSFVPNTSIAYIYISGVVALLILSIACFTYINLSTARSLERGKEVGIRKAVGAYKRQVFWQFICESLLLSVSALALSLIVVMLILPAFEHLAAVHLSFKSLLSPYTVIFSLAMIVCISFVAGSYPALILSGFQPVKVLKGNLKSSISGAWLRKTLIVFQFVISIFLIISTFVIQGQLHYIRNTQLGYDKDHVLVLPFSNKMIPIIQSIKNEFTSNPDVQCVSYASDEPNDIHGGYMMRSSNMAQTDRYAVYASSIDRDYIKTMGLQIVAGSDLTEQDMKDIKGDNSHKPVYHFILNESAARELGWTPQQAIGQEMFLDDEGIVKAVVKDYHAQSLHTSIRPIVLFPSLYASYLLIKVSGKHVPETIKFLESKWKTLIPYYPFEYRFLDDDYNKMYQSEMRLGKIMNFFSAIAIVLACLGLFGLSSYTIQQRRKEIGVRKVLGASVKNIILLIFGDFLKFVLLAFIIAAPVAWFCMRHWLNDYAYKISMPVWVFAAAGVIVLLIALVALSYQTFKAARANPVNNLKTE